MTERLRGARLKLARAEEHFSELVTDHSRFLERNPYRALRETDFKPNSYLWRVKVVEEPPIARWAALVGDCAHALRSALDHVAYALVNANDDAETIEKTEFPIFLDKHLFPGAYPKKLPGVRPEAIAEVERLQPYNGGGEMDPLWIVHMLDIIDKHRRLGLVTSALEGSRYDARGGTINVTDPALGPFVDGAVLGRFTFTPDKPGDPMYMETYFAFGIAFGKGEPAEERSVPPTLENLRVYVAGVISRFERFF